MMIPRLIESQIAAQLSQGNKVVVVYGARQVGKTTLAQKILNQSSRKVLKINADVLPMQEVLSSRDPNKIKGILAGYDILFIDEAQRIPDIGINLKIIHESFPEIKILVTGSSSLDLANRIKEPLTGRTWTHRLYPIAAKEWQEYKKLNAFEVAQQFEPWLLYGQYPEVLLTENVQTKRQYLGELTSAYLYKDILALANIRYPEKLRQLLQLLSFQIGQLVSVNELANSLQVNRDTIAHYLDLLEKSFVIFRMRGFSRNLRKEITRMHKIYFYDLGIRNALIENFNALHLRPDKGQLWENFLMAERIKKLKYGQHFANQYFWRTHGGVKLDYVEEKDGRLDGFEFKWKAQVPRPPKSWTDTYPDASYQVIHLENYDEFIL